MGQVKTLPTAKAAGWHTRLTYRGWRLDGPLEEFHRAVDALVADTVPESYYRKVLASRYRRQRDRQDRSVRDESRR